MALLDNVTINQLRPFVAVCDQGSFSGAARKLNRAQSAISHAIKALERTLDVQLFERRGYSFSECETRLVELLGNPQRFPKNNSQRSVSCKGNKPRRPAMREQQSVRPTPPRRIFVQATRS
jgi:Bacterial regulatory helix-turn-helix protein, lysR family